MCVRLCTDKKCHQFFCPKEVCSYQYLAHGCSALGFKNIEVSIDDFPTVRNFIRLLVHVISLMSGMEWAAFPIVDIFTWKGHPWTTWLLLCFRERYRTQLWNDSPTVRPVWKQKTGLNVIRKVGGDKLNATAKSLIEAHVPGCWFSLATSLQRMQQGSPKKT